MGGLNRERELDVQNVKFMHWFSLRRAWGYARVKDRDIRRGCQEKKLKVSIPQLIYRDLEAPSKTTTTFNKMWLKVNVFPIFFFFLPRNFFL